MQRHILNLNNIPYLIEYYKYDELITTRHVEAFVMLRNYDIVNDIAIDTDIMFIPLSKYKEMIETNVDNQTLYLNDNIVFPYHNKNYEGFSSNIFDIFPNVKLRSLKYREENEYLNTDIKTDYYNLFEKDKNGDFVIAKLKCDKIRIYRPHSRKHINSIISLSNIINNIRFNYFCERYESQKINIGKEIKLNNNYYYEYIEIYVPQIDAFFGANNIYFNEDLNFYQTVNFNNNTFETTSNIINYENPKIPLKNLIVPFSVNKACDRLEQACETCIINKLYQGYQKLSNESEYVDAQNQIINSVKKKSEYYDIVDEYGKKYSALDQWLDALETSRNAKNELNEYLQYSRHDYCPLINIKDNYVKTFLTDDLTGIEYVNSEYNFSNIPYILTLAHYDNLDSTSEHYLSLEGISPTSVVFSVDNQFTLSSTIGFDNHNKGIISVINTWKYPKITGLNDSLLDSYFYFNKITNKEEYFTFTAHDDEIFLENFSDEIIESLNFNVAGCMIEMALDIKFVNIFYRRSVGMDDGIDDFTFNLDNIFSDWKEYPEVIFVRTFFIDKFLSKVFTSNILVLTKEKFKYCINETNGHYKLNLKDCMKEFNFIDKINCTIKHYDVLKENFIGNGVTNGNNQIVYKTVFYKTHDAQKIKVRSNVVQTIGINLGEYLTKVEDFKLQLENYEFVECGRNDVYVLFKIPGSQITNAFGKYDIVDADDDTYITSGDYELI